MHAPIVEALIGAPGLALTLLCAGVLLLRELAGAWGGAVMARFLRPLGIAALPLAALAALAFVLRMLDLAGAI